MPLICLWSVIVEPEVVCIWVIWRDTYDYRAWWAKILPTMSPNSYTVCLALRSRCSALAVEAKSNSVWRRILFWWSSGVREVAHCASNWAMLSLSSFNLEIFSFLLCEVKLRIWPSRKALKVSQRVPWEISGVTFVSIKNFISQI